MSYFRMLRIIISDVYLLLVTYLPGMSGQRLRRRYWKKRLLHLGSGVRIDPGILFQNPQFISIGDNAWIDRDVTILAGPDESPRERIVITNSDYKNDPGLVHIGRNVHIGASCILSGISAGIYISDDCGFSAHCKLYAFSNHYRSPSKPADRSIHFGPRVEFERQSIVEGPIFLGQNTGLALGAVILPGVSIGKNCFVTVSSVVGKGSFPENSLIGGHPAKAIGTRFSDTLPPT